MGGGRRSRVSGTLSLVLLLSLLVPLLAGQALAVGIGVNKGEIVFQDVLQNGYAQDKILVTTDSEQAITGTYQFEGDIAPWLRVEPDTEFFEFSKGNPYELTVILEPPADARLETYRGGIRVLTGEVARGGGGLIGTSTRAAFLVRILAGISGTERQECIIGGVQIRDTEIGQPYEFVATVVNKGNVRIRPEFTIKVYDQSQTTLVQEAHAAMDHDILPTVTEEFTKPITHQLQPGQYWARVESPLCGDSSLLTFDVLERGGIADKGELLRVEAEPWAKTGDIIPINAVFRNLGSRTVDAKFKGTITTREASPRLIKTIDTDTYNVPPGQTARIETFFNPTEPGQYIVAGQVLYNGKLTFQKSTVINVEGPMLVAARQLGGPVLLLILIVIAILILLILIAKKRRRRRA